jgi:hypothetical protein
MDERGLSDPSDGRSTDPHAADEGRRVASRPPEHIDFQPGVGASETLSQHVDWRDPAQRLVLERMRVIVQSQPGLATTFRGQTHLLSKPLVVVEGSALAWQKIVDDEVPET